MLSKVFLTVAALYCGAPTVIAAAALEQCQDIPGDVVFFKGTPPGIGAFGAEGFKSFIGDIVKGLTGLVPHKGPNVTFPLDYFNETKWMESMNASIPHAHAHGGRMKDLPPVNVEVGSGVKNTVEGLLKSFLPNQPKPEPEEAEGHASNHTKPEDKVKLGLTFIDPKTITGLKPAAVKQHNENQTPTDGELGYEELQVKETWGISVPMNVIKVEIVHLNNSKIQDTILVDTEILDSNKTVKDGAAFQQHISLAEWEVADKEWYIVCMTMATVKNDKQVTCQQCLMLRACSSAVPSECTPKFVALRDKESKVTPNSASIQYMVNKVPLDNMKLITKLATKVMDPRCEVANNSYSAIQKSSKLFSNSLVYVDVPKLDSATAYSFVVDLEVNFEKKTKVPFNWPNPLIINDYLESSKQEFVILRSCSSP